jgi:hypothetical protein
MMACADHASSLLTVSELFCDQEDLHATGGNKLSAWDMLQLQMPPSFTMGDASAAGGVSPVVPTSGTTAAVHHGGSLQYKRPPLHPSRVLVNGADVSTDSLDMSALTVTPPSALHRGGKAEHPATMA